MRPLLAALILALILPAAGCGKKPGTLRPEEADRTVTFPRTYPTR
jgi:hypothetical protein